MWLQTKVKKPIALYVTKGSPQRESRLANANWSTWTLLSL